MNTLTWFNYKDTNPDAFYIYRSIPGIQFRFSDISTQGPNFKFSATSPEVQEIIVDMRNINTAIASLSAGKGILVSKTIDNQSIQIRVKATGPQARLKIYQCALAEDIGIAAGTSIVPGSEFKQIGNVGYADLVTPYKYLDYDGMYLDQYYITSTKDGVESLPAFIQKPMLPGMAYCMAEARFIDIQGRPVRGVTVTAEPALLDGSNLSTNKVSVNSDAYGRVSIPLIRGMDYLLHIPAIGYNQYITVPDEGFFDITQWAASTKQEFIP